MLENKEKISLLKGNIKRFAKVFILMLLVVFAVTHKEMIKEMFNYKALYGEAFSGYFKQEKFVKPAEEIPEETLEIKLEKFSYSEKNNFLEIPKLKIEAPIGFEENPDPENLENALKQGVVHYPSSALPGEKGNIIVLGHSAPPGWPKINYDWVFSRLNELETGDEIFIYYNHQKLAYLVEEKFFLQPGQEIPIGQNSQTSNLDLVTCWPPGKNFKRLIVRGSIF